VTTSITRTRLFSRSAKCGAAFLVGGAALGQFIDTAGAVSASLPSSDLAYARLLVGAELLATDFYSQAIAASNTSASVTRYLKRAYFNEQEHYQSVAGILSGAGVTPALSGDITFGYPTGTFASQASIVKFAEQLENTILGAYLGAVGGIQTTSLLTGLAEIAACEAQHSAYFTQAMGGRTFDLSFPPALSAAQATTAMAAYTT